MDLLLLFPSAMVGHSRMTKNNGASMVREPHIQSKRAHESGNTIAL